MRKPGRCNTPVPNPTGASPKQTAQRSACMLSTYIQTCCFLGGDTMFRARQADVVPHSVIEAGKADGFVHVCDQAALMFGSDRREANVHRPVVAIRNDGPRFVVLPCTTKDSTELPDFFALDEQRVMWSRPGDGRRSFACCRYEVVSGGRLRGKIGVMPQAARIELLTWLKSRY
jgi:hypothetical protein